jgi:hypothetical protein
VDVAYAVHRRSGVDITAEAIQRCLPLLGLLLMLVGGTACSTKKCPFGCPAARLGAAVAIVTTPKAVVNGVEAVLAGPVNGSMNCQPNPPVSSVVCDWPLDSDAVVAGMYSLQVSAPGYETTTIQVEVSTDPPDSCGCAWDSIAPSSVSIIPTDAGVD